MIYLDNAATSLQKPKEVEEAVVRAFHTMGNPGRGAHEATLQAGRCVYQVREQLAELFHAEKGENRMLNIFYGDMKEAVYNTAAYFKYDYEDSWIVDPFVKEMIQDVDRSTVLDSGVIDSPVLGKIPPTGLSGGVKTLILVKFEKDKIFNASTCGDNCAKWILKIAQKADRDIIINLRHIMNFGDKPFEIKILNNGKTVHNMKEYVLNAGMYL